MAADGASAGPHGDDPAGPSAAVVVPQAVERLPLFHWRPGARLLLVGSRDGAAFPGDARDADRNTFRRALDPAVLVEAQAKLGTDGCCAAWSASLFLPRGLDLLAAATRGALAVATPGIGDPALLERLLPRVDAWLLLADAAPAPLAVRLLEAGRHVEVLLGLDGAPLPDLPWRRARAMHLVPRRIAAAENDRVAWGAAARAALPSGLRIYDDANQHTDCRRCGERLVWRAGGRSRLDALDPATGACRCGERADIVLG